MRILDRYVSRQFLKIFLICVLGVPFLFEVIDLTDRLDNFLSDGVGQAQVAAYYFYQLPYQMMLAFPIACLLAAVFTVSRMTRHFEVAAAKAGGISFYRLVAPMLVLGMGISVLALSLSDLVPEANRRAAEAIDNDEEREFDVRLNFVYRGDEGRYYFVRRLDAAGPAGGVASAASVNRAASVDGSDAGADALVMFNRFYQPDIDLDEMAAELRMLMRTETSARPR